MGCSSPRSSVVTACYRYLARRWDAGGHANSTVGRGLIDSFLRIHVESTEPWVPGMVGRSRNNTGGVPISAAMRFQAWL
jgi:hypothetical protein